MTKTNLKEKWESSVHAQCLAEEAYDVSRGRCSQKGVPKCQYECCPKRGEIKGPTYLASGGRISNATLRWIDGSPPPVRTHSLQDLDERIFQPQILHVPMPPFETSASLEELARRVHIRYNNDLSAFMPQNSQDSIQGIAAKTVLAQDIVRLDRLSSTTMLEEIAQTSGIPLSILNGTEAGHTPPTGVELAEREYEDRMHKVEEFMIHSPFIQDNLIKQKKA